MATRQTKSLSYAVYCLLFGGALLFLVALVPWSPPHQEIEALQAHEEPWLTRKGSFELIRSIPHDPTAFCQGLVQIQDGNHTLYFESTGLYGNSTIRQLDMEGNVLKQRSLPAHLFGEGLSAVYENDEWRLVQLTWKEGIALVYTLDLELIENRTLTTSTGQGWGLTTGPNKQLYVTDGSNNLQYGLKGDKRVAVQLQWPQSQEPQLVPHLNALQYDNSDDTILAHVWYQDVLVRIQPESGKIVCVYQVQLSRPDSADCFNGITRGSQPDTWWVTGKLWDHMYEIRLVD